ncbi:MAG: MFS transporter [Pseudomonadota bacterium]
MNSSIERHLPKTAPDAEKEAQAPGLGIYAALVGLYVAQAIPLYLVAAALPPILRANGINLAVIGGLGMLMLPWVLKALWAPWIDRVAHNPAVGRKGVVAVAQVMIFALICVLATLDPVADIALFFPLLMAMSLASATQDIAADGYAVEHLPPEWQARGSAIQSGSIAVGVLIGGSLTLFLYDLVGWQISVMAAGCASIFALCGFFLIPESHGKRTQSQPTHIPKLRAFAAQPAALSIFGFALIFRLPEGLIKSLEQSFLVDSGFSLTTIGILSGGSAAFVGLFGTFIGMIAIRRFGLWSFFAFFIALRSLIFAGYGLAAQFGLPEDTLIGLSLLNTFSRYMEVVGLFAAFMRVASLTQAGTDFTILSSANLFVYMAGSMIAGILAELSGYAFVFWLACALSVITGLVALQLLRVSTVSFQAAAPGAAG